MQQPTDVVLAADDLDPSWLFDAAIGRAEIDEVLDEAELLDDAFEADVHELAQRRARR